MLSFTNENGKYWMDDILISAELDLRVNVLKK